MFNIVLKRPSRLLRYIVIVVGVPVSVLAVWATPSPTPIQETAVSSGKEMIAWFVSIAAVITIIGNVAWSFFSRKNYDKLKETINDLESVLKARDLRIENLKLTCSETEARLTLEITEQKAAIKVLNVSNLAVVSMNLQMKAILKKLRMENKWDGHEDDLFNTLNNS